MADSSKNKNPGVAWDAPVPSRCSWSLSDPMYIEYHDKEWGVPVHDDRRFFEFLILEGAQAGLSWLTILRKRGEYTNAFDGFDFNRVARYSTRDIARLMKNAGIVRNRLKIESAIGNARAFQKVREEFGTFDAYAWHFVGGHPLQNTRRSLKDIPPTTKESDRLSKDLKKRGFNFVGSTICYAFMQATGLVNDHLVGCFRHREVAAYSEHGK